MAKWETTWADRGNVLTTELNALAAGSRTNVGTELVNNTNLDEIGKLEIGVTFASAPAAGDYLDIHMVQAPDGTNYEDGSSTVDPGPHTLKASVQVRAVDSAQRIMTRMFQLEPGKTKFILVNRNASQAFPATGSTVKLYTTNG